MSMAAASFVSSHPLLQFRSNLMDMESNPVACVWRPPLLKSSPSFNSSLSWSINCSTNSEVFPPKSEDSSSSPVFENCDSVEFPVEEEDEKRMRSKNKKSKEKRMAQSAPAKNSSKSVDKQNEEDKMTLLRKRMLGDLEMYKWREPEWPLPYT